jgi:predicted ATPase
LPDVNHLPPVESLNQYEAVKLFIDRATAAIPTFKVTNHNAPALAQICYRLDGIPLAIELAAAKVRVLSVEQIAKRLDDRFRLLTGGSRTALEHHQTLRAAIDWSYNLLPPVEQVLFSRLSVFSGGWTLEAAESICEGGSVRSEEVLTLLEQLINKSLVIMEEIQGESRYHMLETIRQYADEKLSGREGLREQHAAYFVTLAETMEPSLEKPEPASWLNKLEGDHNNFRAALRWARETGQVESGLRLASALCLFWFMRGYLDEGLAQISEFLSLSERTVDTTTRAKALDHAGMLARYRGDLDRAYELIAEGLSLRRTLGERHGIADSLSNLGFVVLHQGDFIQARQLYSEALSIHRELDNQQGIADSLSHLALMAYYDGDYESAQAMDQSSLAIWRRLGDQQGIAWALHRLGNVKLHQNEYSAARDLFKESLTISNDVGFKWGIAFAAEGLASFAACTGQATRAVLLAAGAAALRQAIGVPLSAMAQADLEHMLAPARKVLGEEATQEIWSKGLGLTIEEIVAEAKT